MSQGGDVDTFVAGERGDDTGTRLVVEAELDLLARYVLQEALQVAEVEADAQTRTSLLTGAGDRLLSSDREVKVLTSDADRVIGEVEDHEAAGAVEKSETRLRSEEELILVNDDIVYRTGGDDGVVVGNSLRGDVP